MYICQLNPKESSYNYFIARSILAMGYVALVTGYNICDRLKKQPTSATKLLFSTSANLEKMLMSKKIFFPRLVSPSLGLHSCQI